MMIAREFCLHQAFSVFFFMPTLLLYLSLPTFASAHLCDSHRLRANPPHFSFHRANSSPSQIAFSHLSVFFRFLHTLSSSCFVKSPSSSSLLLFLRPSPIAKVSHIICPFHTLFNLLYWVYNNIRPLVFGPFFLQAQAWWAFDILFYPLSVCIEAIFRTWLGSSCPVLPTESMLLYFWFHVPLFYLQKLTCVDMSVIIKLPKLVLPVWTWISSLKSLDLSSEYSLLSSAQSILCSMAYWFFWLTFIAF